MENNEDNKSIWKVLFEDKKWTEKLNKAGIVNDDDINEFFTDLAIHQEDISLLKKKENDGSVYPMVLMTLPDSISEKYFKDLGSKNTMTSGGEIPNNVLGQEYKKVSIPEPESPSKAVNHLLKQGISKDIVDDSKNKTKPKPKVKKLKV
jgi:hypothetical protein